MFDAFLTLAAERDRVCVVASLLPEERVWGLRQTRRFDDEPISFDTSHSATATELAAQLRSLPVVPEEADSDIEPDSEGIL